jgi:hypothetical protein
MLNWSSMNISEILSIYFLNRSSEINSCIGFLTFAQVLDHEFCALCCYLSTVIVNHFELIRLLQSCINPTINMKLIECLYAACLNEEP